MRDLVVAKRYAKAMYEIAKEHNKISEFQEEFTRVTQAIRGDEQVVKFLNHPNLHSSKKIHLLHDILQGKVSEIVLNAISVLVENNRINILQAIIDDFTKIADEALGQAKAILYSPVQLSQSELNDIQKKFSSITKKTIRLETVVDPSLLGGIQVKIGDRLFDGSLANQLNRLTKTLEQSQVM
jgi:F-type H+-transporting ATPase subunit delta